MSGKDVGLESPAEVLRVELSEASYRIPAEYSFTREGGKVIVKVSKAAGIHLAYRALCPDWPADRKPALRRHGAADSAAKVEDTVVVSDGAIDWHAVPGEYELADH